LSLLLLKDIFYFNEHVESTNATSVIRIFLATSCNKYLPVVGFLMTFEHYLRQLFDPGKIDGLTKLLDVEGFKN
jgi:hypothetical protein